MRLSDLYQTLSSAERQSLADAVEIRPRYLWQIATGWRPGARSEKLRPPKRPSVALIAALCAADARLHVGDLVAEFAEAPPEAKVAANA